jgi:HPt (histidine-containing phosphotransfer) domain-containing protein
VIRHAELGGSRLPIIAVTANAMQGEALRCRERGMDDYLSKPLRLNELGPMLVKWLPLAAVVSEVVAEGMSDGVSDVVSDAVPSAPTPESPVWDAAVLPRMVGNNLTMHKRLLEKFLLSAAEQTGRINAAAAIDDTATVSRVAHALKSAARTVGALQMGELCQVLETAGNAGNGTACKALAEELGTAFAAVMADVKDALAAPAFNEA